MKKQNRNAFAYISNSYFIQGNLMFNKMRILLQEQSQESNLPTRVCLIKLLAKWMAALPAIWVSWWLKIKSNNKRKENQLKSHSITKEPNHMLTYKSKLLLTLKILLKKVIVIEEVIPQLRLTTFFFQLTTVPLPKNLKNHKTKHKKAWYKKIQDLPHL